MRAMLTLLAFVGCATEAPHDHLVRPSMETELATVFEFDDQDPPVDICDALAPDQILCSWALGCEVFTTPPDDAPPPGQCKDFICYKTDGSHIITGACNAGSGV